MCDALRELMKDDLEDARKMGEAKGKAEGKIMGEAKIILKMNPVSYTHLSDGHRGCRRCADTP